MLQGRILAESLRAGCDIRVPDLRIAHGQKNIAEAWLTEPTGRYRHFVLGAAYEAANLTVRLKDSAGTGSRLSGLTQYTGRSSFSLPLGRAAVSAAAK